MKILKKLMSTFIVLMLLITILMIPCFASSSGITDSAHRCISVCSNFGMKVFTYDVCAQENYTYSGGVVTGTSRNLFIYDSPSMNAGGAGLYKTVDTRYNGSTSSELLRLSPADYVPGSYILDGARTYYMYHDNRTTFSYYHDTYTSKSVIDTYYALDDGWSPGMFTFTDTFTICN